VRIGLLFDYPQGDGGEGIEHALTLGIAASGHDPAGYTFVRASTLGLPAGSSEDVADGFGRLADAGVDLIVGPSISDNCLAARDAADVHRVPAINYSGGERTRSEWMFHYQIGSLEEEPPLLVARMRERGLGRAAVIHDASVVGERYSEVLGWAARDAGIELTARAPIDPLAEDLAAVVTALRADAPDVLVYLGLGAASHAVATAMADAAWTIPVLANSALMFGYVRPDWRDAWANWEYIDTIADDNVHRRALGELDPASAAGPIGTAAYDMGRLVGHAAGRAERIDRPGLREGLERVKQLPAASGYEGTLMGFGVWDRAALKGPFLVLRAWRDGRSVQVAR
jgi:branched-chain amino acid transport system substrate-binding protein